MGDTLTVTTLEDENNTDGDCSLREAIAAANTNMDVDACIRTGDTDDEDEAPDLIVFSTRLAPGRIDLGSEGMTVSDSLVIDGSISGERVEIDGDRFYRIFRVTDDFLALDSVVVRGARASRGGGVLVDGAELRVTNSVFEDNEANGDAADQGGAAIYNASGTVTVADSDFNTNRASGSAGSGGAVFNNGGTLTVTNTTFVFNTARRAGGAIEATGSSITMLTDVDFEDNEAGTSPGNGGAFHITGAGDAVIRGGLVTENEAASEGGGFWNGTGTMSITETTFIGNVALGSAADNGGGALFNSGGRLEVDSTTVAENVASGAASSGGGILNADGELIVTSSTFTENVASRAGGAIEAIEGETILAQSTFERNDAGSAPGNGGAFHITGSGDAWVAGGSFRDNRASAGGALWSSGDLAVVTDEDNLPSDLLDDVEVPDLTLVVISGNVAAANGGGIWTSGTLTVNGGAGSDDGTDDDGDDRSDDDDDARDGDRAIFVPITGNTAAGADAGMGGGGLYVAAGDASLRYVTLDGNVASGAAGSGGGVLVADGGMLRVALSEVTGNTANRAGAGIELFDDAENDLPTDAALREVIVDGNGIATAAPGNGGGIHVGGAGAITIRQSIVSDNTAREGGGIWVAGEGSADIGNSTVSGNTATEAGGGVYDNGGATIELSSATVAMNEAGTDGGGLLSQGEAFSFQNTIVAMNTAGGMGADCAGAFDSDGNNLIETAADCTISGDTGSDIVDTPALLSPLADNGGFTRTHNLISGSPAFDNGDSAFDVDQRGFDRSEAADDIGALEVPAPPVSNGDDPDANGLALAAARPNPATGSTTVAFTVAEAAQARVELYNVLGQRVLTAFDGTAAPGTEVSVDVDLAPLAAGVYLVRLESAGQVVTRQLTVVR